jgi:hypothetical protein
MDKDDFLYAFYAFSAFSQCVWPQERRSVKDGCFSSALMDPLLSWLEDRLPRSRCTSLALAAVYHACHSLFELHAI